MRLLMLELLVCFHFTNKILIGYNLNYISWKLFNFIESVRSAAEAESDAEDLIVESESDSDQSNQDGGQRSVQTGATAGSDSGW